MYAHGCQNIANRNHEPRTLDETLLLREQNNFMYDAFTTVLQTMVGAHFTTICKENGDTQKVWRDYTTHMMTSTSADMQIEELMISLALLRLSQTYCSTTQIFLIYWLCKMVQYEQLTPLEAHCTNTVKKAVLQNAVLS